MINFIIISMIDYIRFEKLLLLLAIEIIVCSLFPVSKIVTPF